MKRHCNRPCYAVQMRKGRGEPWHDVTEPLFIEDAFRVRRKLMDALNVPDDTNIGHNATVRVGGVGTRDNGIGSASGHARALRLPRRKDKTREYRLRTLRRLQGKRTNAAKNAVRT